MPWTRFMDMHSGGGTKEPPYEYIYIEAAQAEAQVIFYNRFGHNPERVTCTCCGEDYSISSEQDLATLTAYERGCDYAYFAPDGTELGDDDYWRSVSPADRWALSGRYVERPSPRRWSPYTTLEEYMKRDDVLFVPASHIKPEERRGTVPVQGYVWQG